MSSASASPTRRVGWRVIGSNVGRLAAVAALAACVTTTTRYFLRSPQNPSYRASSAESVLRDYVQLQCPGRRAAQRPDTGSATFLLEVDSAGRAMRAQLVRSSRDSLLDGIFGAVAAQLALDAGPAPIAPGRARGAEPLHIGFRCVGDSAAVQVRVGGG